MGNKHGKRKNYELCEFQFEKEFQVKFPWNEIVQWGSQDVNVDMTLAGIEKTIEEIKDITTDEETYFKMTQVQCIDPFHFDDDLVMWAQSLLKENRNLRRIRYNLVPRVLSENEFWMRYFSAIKLIVTKNAFEGEQGGGGIPGT
ncbi:BSD-domain protein, putative [Plasmodium vivax]|uniref:BSD domain-containing protein n=6 Tax=Plasmodium vivax TaxID=5855 RepID=A5K670_PLAVS|nr:hypothetical protein, conserved [Plasmodium vivax]KMZ81765.1 hypothetical protein PVIIG_04264 [Plasmodium vivax India VII]KMZ87918.1 hypothetical protein PVBG_05366 [Plasmodium vivax Brazil I]KMZ94326.1 hypothetical protein PVMG_05378 [Plasmodium vivax Mauritania I]KNA00946.1 hypothetical protein PVNG_03053 [Plasmodium vivax North Korean]EDL45405.1 hypothetical protein, conserved [Plasmodium vivax]|eukprot:XP_001615132.1 hypothetical protein [Plasmodium vivax Sal-1]